MRLDAKTVAALKLGGKTDAIYFDEDLAGFGYRLRLGAGGKVRRSWIAQFKRAGATRRMLLGGGEVLSAEQARLAAKKVLARVALGEDPARDRRDRRDKDKLSVRFIIDEYLAAKEEQVRPRTFVEVKRYLASGPYFRPLHGMPIDTVSRKDIATRLVAIAREHGNTTASRARGALATFFVWALQSGIVEANPVVGTAKPKDSESRDRVLSDAELVSIWRACGELGEFGMIVKLCVLTACRRSEIGGLRWGELDLERGLLTIPPQRAKNGRRHQLPLTPLALDVIRSVPRRMSSDQLFGQRTTNGFSRWVSGKRALDQRSGVTNFVLHDIRRSTATKLADLGVQPHIIEQILNHVSGHKAGPAGIYNRSSYTNEVRNTLLLWDDHLHTLIEGGERKILHMSPPAS